MSKTYRVFLGAPSLVDIPRDPTSYSWRTFSSFSSAEPTPLSRRSTLGLHADQSIMSLSLTEANFATKDFVVEDIDAPSQIKVDKSASMILPVDLLETASERISMIYKDAIFGEENDDEELVKQNSGRPLSEEREEKEVEISVFQGVGMMVNVANFIFV